MRNLDEDGAEERPCVIVPLHGDRDGSGDPREGHPSTSGYPSAEELLRPEDDFGEAADTSDERVPAPFGATRRKLARTIGLRRKK